MTRSITSALALPMSQLSDVAFLPNAKAGTFFARDNVSNFIGWCRNSLGIIECLLFETDDLIMRKNERHVILCLLEVARRGAKFGMLAPMLVQMERQIDRELAAENKANGAGNEDSDDDYGDDMHEEEPCLIYGPQPQIVTNDLKSLDEMVSEIIYRALAAFRPESTLLRFRTRPNIFYRILIDIAEGDQRHAIINLTLRDIDAIVALVFHRRSNLIEFHASKS